MKVLITFILFPLSMAGFTQVQFVHLDIDDGLSQNSVTSLIQDHQGFMWFGTEHGLNRYDGYEFKKYSSRPDQGGLSGDQIWSVFEDSAYRMYIGTDQGLCVYDRAVDSFYPIDSVVEHIEKPINGVVGSIYEDRENNLWLGTWTHGIYRLDETRLKLSHYPIFQHATNSYDYRIRSIAVVGNYLYASTWGHGLLQMNVANGDFQYLNASNSGLKTDGTSFLNETIEEGFLWLSTRRGLQKFDLESQTFHETGNPILDTLRLAGEIAKIDDKIWASGYGSGLYVYSPKSDKVEIFRHEVDQSTSLSSDLVIDIVKDNSGCVWVATWTGGLNKYCPDLNKFKCCDEIELNNVFGVEKWYDRLMVGTYGQGVFLVDVNKSKREAIPGPNDYILDLEKDARGNMLIAYDGFGIGVYKPTTKAIVEADFYNDLLPTGSIHVLKRDSKGTVWVGTHGQGVVGFHKDSSVSTFNTTTNPALSNDFVYAIEEQTSGNLLIGTYGGGFNVLGSDRSQVQKFQANGAPGSLPSNNIWDIYEAEDNTVWLATNQGLAQWDSEKGIFNVHNEKSGLKSEWVYCILEDTNNNLWLSTNGGLSVFDREVGTIKNYNSTDGLQSNEFDANAKLKDDEGYLHFGGIKGLNRFKPTDIISNEVPPKMVFTNLAINGDKVEIAINGPLKQNISLNPSITLTHQDNIVSFDFAALHFLKPENNQYKYRLKGFHKEWINSGTRNFATFTNLGAGSYTLEVLGANSDGIWASEPATLAIEVLPPPWRSWWAYLIYSVLFVGFIALIIRTFVTRERLKAKIRFEHLELEKMHEIDQIKTRFFTNISHEFRTPLTLVLSPLTQLIGGEKDKNKKRTLSIIQRNAKRLLGLINELLDLSKLEAGKLKLNVAKADVTFLLRMITASFSSLADHRGIEFSVELPPNETFIYFDKEQLEKVVVNLLSNAIKFTPNHEGAVNFNASVNDNCLTIHVENTGDTISETDQKKIFNRFYQANQNVDLAGTGVGLALVKELVELHRGKIFISSKEGLTRFTLQLPVAISDFEQNEIRPDKKDITSVAISAETQAIEALEKQIEASVEEKPLLMIVEDNEDMRVYLEAELRGEYVVEVAQNGLDGFDMASKYIPDIIVSDFMMPVMDGLAMLQKVRDNQQTSHIPVVMLTAKADFESRISGIEKGADHYLTKPFEMSELKIRIKSLLDQRARVSEHYRLEFLAGPTNTEKILSADEQFLKKLTHIIDQHLSESQFSVDKLASEMALSRVQLHRKLKATIGCSASEFVRQYRLKLAYQYLKAEKGTVSEIAYEVGFNNLSYFAKCFKETYRVNPSEVVK
ncbi:MAG: two-component regulator propeller domain-containing protein [Fulvivirga sp.]